MPKRKCIFNKKLEEMYPFLQKTDDSRLSCLKCGGHFSMATRGRGDILIHIKSKKHQKSDQNHGSNMDPNSVSKLQMCRICRTSDVTSATNLFEGSHNLLTRIQNLTGCSLTGESYLPQCICKNCEKNLEIAHNFKKTCLESQLFFLEVWKHEKNEEDVTEKSIEYLNENAAVNLDVASNILLDDEGDALESSNEIEVLEVRNTSKDINAIALNDELDVLTVVKARDLNTTECLITSKIHSEESESHNISGGRKKATFICDRCGNHFTSQQHFKTHLRRHENTKPFRCEVCPKQCFTPTELKHHMRRHTGERPFACQYCPRRFTDYSTRVRHERTHTNERPYGCTQCEKTFTRANLLRKHLLVHTGERPFACIECNKSFQTRTSLTVHCRSIMHKQMADKRKNDKEMSSVGCGENMGFEVS